MPVTSWRPPAVSPRLCCRLLRCDGADGSSRGFDGMALGGGNPFLQRLSVRLAPASAPDLSLSAFSTSVSAARRCVFLFFLKSIEVGPYGRRTIFCK